MSPARGRVAALGGAMLAALPAGAAPLPDLDRILDLCASTTIAQAATQGDALGWDRAEGPRYKAWRDSFVAYNGGSVEAVSWRRGTREADGQLSFWIARGPNAHRACTYSVPDPEGLLDALTRRFGAAPGLDRQSYGAAAMWSSGGATIAYSAVGAGALLNVSRSD